jgi:hypothetical protein
MLRSFLTTRLAAGSLSARAGRDTVIVDNPGEVTVSGHRAI